MRLLFLGDLVGSCGRQAVVKTVPRLREQLRLDFVVVNGENVAGGRGITQGTAEEIFSCGVDVISGGNHSFQHREVYRYLDEEPAILRPANYPPGAPGHGIVELRGLTVINVIGRTFMGADYDDPFRSVDALVSSAKAGNAILVDFHAEATSEKQAMGWYLDGRASVVVGTHTHVPTADQRILPRGTAFCTDAGMCGARDSVIGDDVASVLQRFLTQLPTRLPPAEGTAIINGILVEIDDSTGRARSIVRSDHVID